MTTVAPATGEEGGGVPVAAGGESTTTMGTSEPPLHQAPSPSTPAQQHPPPSPLSGCYLLVVLPEPHTIQHKDLILNRLAKGFLSWDKDSCHVDLEKELQALVAQSPEGEEARNGERLIQYATENLVTEVLIFPQSNTLLQCIRNLLASFTKHRHIIHAGYTFGGNGSWILQDGTFSLADFLDAFSEHEVQRVLRAYENSVTVDIHCAGVGDWTTSRLSREACTRACRVRVNPDDVLTAGVPAITSFTNYVGQYLVAQTLDQLMEPSDVVGNIRFSHPTLYVFPGGQGDAALFGINGFNMLVDGGFARKACFWDFARHLDRLDAVLVTRINNSNVGGMSSVLRKKKEMHVYPQIGHFFCNLVERKHSNSPDGDKDIDPLILNLIDMGQDMMSNLRHINLRPHPCYRDPEPINLYHKVGHGTLDMYVLSPSKDSREVREFMAKWNASDSRLFAGLHRKDSSSIIFPVQNLVSICALLVWQPANPEDTITRILFPGSTPQHKIFEGFDRLKHLEFLKRPVCTAKSLSPSASLMTLKDKASILKPKYIERETKRLAEMRREKRDLSAPKKDSAPADDAKNLTARPSLPISHIKTETKAKKVVENKKIESETKEKIIEKELKETKKEVKKVEKPEKLESETKKTDAVKIETEKTAPVKEPKIQKIEIKKKEIKEASKTTVVKSNKSESVTKPPLKPLKKRPDSSGEKKDIMKPSPTTPKKTINGAANKTEVTKSVSKSVVKTTTAKISSVGPAKSAKDANNRKVVEQKNIELSSIAGSTATAAAGAKAQVKSKTTERKAITRRTKPLSPAKARLPLSPAKTIKSAPKTEKEAVIRRGIRGGTSDSSAVSTPSKIEGESAVKLIDKNLTEKSEDMSLDSIESKVLADLKEEREVVEEIEAVLQKAERIEEARKEERFDGDDEITAEALDDKEKDVTEEDITAEMDDAPKKIARKESQELTEEDEYLIVEKEEIYTEDSAQSYDAEHKHHLDEAESEKIQKRAAEEGGSNQVAVGEDKESVDEKMDEIPEKSLVEAKEKDARKSVDFSSGHKEVLEEEAKKITTSATEVTPKVEEKDISGKKDSEEITKEPSSLSPDKLDSSPKPEVDQKDLPEKLEGSQERISTLESGATTTAPTLPEDEKVPLDDIKEDVDEKHVIEEVKEKDLPSKEKEIIPETLPPVSKPEVKVLDVRPVAQQSIQRDVVKTPDEVADLPVHEEVDPKLYSIDDLEKDKDTKEPIPSEESKEPATPPVKEQKGVFSFFGKVADKFEKGYDKLTKKNRRDSEKDIDEKSSKSNSPKEPKPVIKDFLESPDMDKVFLKVGQSEEKVEVEDTQQAELFEANKSDDLDNKLLEENTADVEAFIEETTQKFKNVKDSLQDSLESLEDKVEKQALSGGEVEATLSGAAEKLDESLIDSKEPDKVKFIIPSSEDLEEDDDSDGVVRDFKEAVREVAGVLVGTAGIEIEKEDKSKDVEEIVKKVAKVLKEDDFLTEKTLLSHEHKEDAGSQSATFISHEADVLKKTDEFEFQGQSTDKREVVEEPFVKISDKEVMLPSPVTDSTKVIDHKKDKEDALKMCEDLLNDDIIIKKPVSETKTGSKVDVMDSGIEEICVKKVAERERYEEIQLEEDKIEVEPHLSFEQNLSPGKAELVTVTPGSTPTSPKLATSIELPEIPLECKNILNQEKSLENILQEFLALKKYKVNEQILEYIIVLKHVPKKKVINVIQELIIKQKIPRENVVDNIQILRAYDVLPEKRLELENHIKNEYLNKNKKITCSNIEKISAEKCISQSLVIEIIEEMVFNNGIPRNTVLEISDESYVKLLETDLEEESEAQAEEVQTQVEDDSILDGFVNISSKEVVEAFLHEERKKSLEEAKIVDDFEAVEQEYKVDGFSVTDKLKKHLDIDVDDVSEHVSETIEADEKFVKETAEKSSKEKESVEIEVAKKISISQAPEISDADTKEKYLDEEKEKTSSDLPQSSEDVDVSEVILDNQKMKTADLIDIKDISVELKEEISEVKRASEVDEGTVKKMFVTASSEDGGHETEICASGTITFTKTPTPDDSLRSIDVKSTPERDSLNLDKDSLQSADSTPEKDSMSDKSYPKGGKITPDDSLEKPLDNKLVTEDVSPAETVFSSAVEVNQRALKSKSPSVEKEVKKEGSPEVSSVSDHITVEEVKKEDFSKPHGVEEESLVGEVCSEIIKDQSKSPSVEKEILKEPSPEKMIISDTGKSKSPSIEKEVSSAAVISEIDYNSASEKVEKSKSPSVENEIPTKDASPEKIVEKSKSPSAEREILKETDKSKSPSVEKELVARESSPEKIVDKSKSPSAERDVSKEPSPEKSIIADTVTEVETLGKSKSPSVEKEISEKEPMSEKLIDRSKSPSAEKELSKDPLLEDDKFRSTSVEKDTGARETSPEKIVDKSKSPSAEREILKETSAEVDKSKSPSVEKELPAKESSPEKIVDKSKSPSAEREVSKEPSSEKSLIADTLTEDKIDKSQSPSVEKEIAAQEPSPEKVADKSKSPSAEREVTKEPSPATDDKSEKADKSKSPSVEKEVPIKETSPEKIADKSKSPSAEREILKETSVDDHKSKSPSVEKELVVKEQSPEKIVEKSKSPSPEKDLLIDTSPVKSGTFDTEIEDKRESADKSKSSSVEKDVQAKEPSPEKSNAAEIETDDKVEKSDKSKSPSVEKEIDTKEFPPEKIDKSKSPSAEREVIKEAAKSKSPSVEKELSAKEPTPEKIVEKSKSPSPEKEVIKESSPIKSGVTDTVVEMADKSKSPSVEKDIQTKEASPEKVVDQSKSPSVEKELSKQLSSENLSTNNIQKEEIVSTGISAREEAQSKSKSPSMEKEITVESSLEKTQLIIETHGDSAISKSKSPSAETESCAKQEILEKTSEEILIETSLKLDQSLESKEKSSEKIVTDDAVKSDKLEDKSKSPSAERELSGKESSPEKIVDQSELSGAEKEVPKEPSPEKLVIPETEIEEKIEKVDKSKSPSMEKEVMKESSPDNIADRSKSPSAEKEIMKETSPTGDRSKSPSVEKELSTKELSSEKTVDRSKSPSAEKEVSKEPLSEIEKSKSPSVEKEIATKEPSPEKIVDKSKSPSAEREVTKDPSLAADDKSEKADKSKSPSVEKEVPIKETSPEKIADKSKSPSAEREILKETSVDDHKSKSPSVEKELLTKEPSPEKIIVQSKSPSAEKEVTKEPTPEKSAIADTVAEEMTEKIDKSKSPSVEKEIPSGEPLSEKIVDKSKSPSAEREVPQDTSKGDKSKSPSVERDSLMKQPSLEKIVDESKSPSAEKEILIETSAEVDKSKSPSVEKELPAKESSPEKIVDKSKSSSAEREVSKEPSPEKSIISDTLTEDKIDTTDKSKSPSVEKEIAGKEPTPEKTIDLSKSPSAEKDLLKDQSLEAHKSKSPSVEKEITERESSPEKIVDKSKSPSAERELSKEPSLEKSLAEDKTQAKDKSKSPSVEKELGLKEPSPEKSLGSATSEFVEKDHAIEGFIARKSLTETELVEKIDKSRSPSAEKEVTSAGKSISVTPVSEKSELLQTTVEVRKSSVSSADLGSEEKGRSRSHSLFDAGEKTPLSRSRAASLYEDKFVEKVGSFESIKDQFGHSESIFEEKDEIRLSEETIDELQKDSMKRESISTESSSTESQKYETRKSVEDHIKNEYVLKNKLITLHDINELSIKYKIDRSIIMQIIDDVIVSLKINRDTLINFDKAESDLPLLDTSDEEEKLNFYINDEYIAKKKKINSKTVDEIASSKLVTRQLVILVIENIIKAQSLDRNLIMDQDLLGQDLGAQLDQFDPVGLSDSRKQSISSKSIIDKIDLSESPSSSPEPIFGLKSDRSEPHIDEEIIISESKRTEIETILLDDYVTRGKKINKSILDEIVIKTHTPKYIIIEIIEEILIKRHLTRDAIADQSIFEVIDDDESTQPKIPEDDKSSTAATSKRSSIASSQYFDEGLAKSLPYTDYESPFHKAFMGGMTEIRTTHITTTLSGKSTPESGLQDESSDYLSGMATSMSTTMTSLPEKHEVTSKVDDNVDNLIGSIQRKSITETVPTHVYAETIETVTNVIKHEIPEKIETFSMEAQELDQNKDIVTSKTIISTVESDAPIADLLKTGEKVLTSSIQTIETTSSTVTEGNLISLESLSKDAISEFSSQIDPNIKTLLDANKSLFDLGHEDKVESAFSSEDLIDHSIPEHLGQSSSSIIRDLMAEEKSYSGKSSPDVSMPKDTGSSVTGKSTPDIPMSPLIRDGSMMQSHFSGRSTPDKRSDRGSRTTTPEGFRSGDVIRTIITTTRTMSDDGEIITTTQEVTETTNEKGETVVLAQKTDVTVDEKLPEMFTSDVKSIDSQRTDSPGSDLVHKEIDPASDLSVSSQPISTHIGSSEEHHPYSDEEHSSPASSFSPHHSSDSRQTVQETTMTTTTTKKSSEDFTSAAMSSSFYGELPSESTQFTSSFTKSIESFPEQEEFSFKKFTVEREFAGGFTERKSSKKYIDEADLDFEKALTESQTEKDEHHSETSSVLGAAAASFTQELSKSSESKASSDKGVDKKDPLAGWDSPLGLPSPKAPRKFILRSTPIQPTSSADLSPDSLNFDVINDWGEPMRLPSPAVNSGAATTTGTTNEVSNKGSPGTPKKEKKQQEKKIISENLKNKKRSESPAKRYKDSRNKVQPVYVDLTYVSHHGNSFYTALEFFKKVRARYYVFSGTEPSREVYDALLEAKKTWEDKDLEVTMIPTYDTDTLGYWVADNEEALATYHIDLSPSASRCTINLQDHETSCSAYRLEF